ncbi:MAG: NfeD family protein, partial [Gammaproteobacteria bacterium]
IILFDKEGGNLAVSMPVIVSVAVLSAGFFFIAVRSSVNAYRRPVVSGREEMIGNTGVVMEDFAGKGRIFIHGETWQASSSAPMHRGEKAVVTGINGLILEITPVKES